MNRDDKSELPMALRSAYLTMHRQTDAALQEFGVTADQFVLLATLWNGDALTQRELARRMPSDPSTVRAMLVLLEKQGLILRSVPPDDARARMVTLTAAGKRKFKQLWKVSESIRSKMFDCLDSESVAKLVHSLRNLTSALDGDSVSDQIQKV